MNIIKATRSFESWLGKRIDIVPEDLDFKHRQMKADPFLFFRATFYRWCQLWPREYPKLGRATETLAVGDLHLENFGTWRDHEGRLVWGVNDFDEAYPMAFTNDLARLAVSVFLAADAHSAFAMKQSGICDAILQGYVENMKKGGDPFVLMEKHPLLRSMAFQDLRDPGEFWSRLDSKTLVIGKKAVPEPARTALLSISPPVEFEMRLVTSPKGLGSLGRQRYLAVADWEGGRLAREAKAVAPSAWLWARGKKAGKGNPYLNETAKAAVRCADPYYVTRRNWLVRRLAPDCSRIDIDELAHHRDRKLLLVCMGAETANIHLGKTKAQRCILKDLEELPRHWLLHAAQKLHRLCLADWEKFGRH